ncbi:MAG TPA: hypothetical protein DCS45_17040 [Roseovarius nubinhibens]|uniref:Uncharacterized protein n=1 Tax=Roseovarius nubinhibens TaxID=314263 RepID=A0A348WG96_9RHOB|nr:hypothetical protein [Roseovarius nubinhibens]
MNSIIEMAVALNHYRAGKLASSAAASTLAANLASLNSVETSELRKLVQSVGFSLADVEWTGADSDLTEKLTKLQFQLNKLTDEMTSKVDVPEYLIDEFHPEQLLGIDVDDTRSYELRKENSTGAIFLCSRDSEKQLGCVRKFSDFNEFEEAIWAA